MRPDFRRVVALAGAMLLLAAGGALAQANRGGLPPGIGGVPGGLPGFTSAPPGPGTMGGAPPVGTPATQPPPVFDRRSLADIPGQQRGIERLGSPTQAEGGPSLVAPLGDQARVSGPATAVFGASLFTGQPQSSSDAPNPNYVLAPGDRVSVRAWGAVESEIVGVIDPAGNLFLPNIGPIPLAGVRVGDLQSVVEAEIRKVYTAQVQVYATTLSTQRIGVFVTGFVRQPGRYAGVASDSILDFLVRAGGVDPGRGSHREITLRRGNATVASVDLYRFLLDGTLPQLRLQEGDTIVVGRQRAMVGADGAVRNNYLFESTSRASLTGRELIELARPLPAATNAVVRGVRNAQPFSRYMSVAELASQTLLDQDTVTFVADVAARTMRVTVEGSRLYPSVLVADRDMTLCQILDHIAVDPALADTEGVFLLRPSLAQSQKRAIDEALDRLERQLFLAPAATTRVADARAQEAQMITQYISRARRTQPEGRLVVMGPDGRCSPLRLENGDIIVIPERSQTVFVQGEVNFPQAVVWREGWSAAQFIEAAGGLTPRGRMSTLMLRRPSGQAILNPQQAPRPGDELIVLPYLDPKVWQFATDLVTALFQVALAARVFRD
ncbi:protein involved in polysaccharide export with SLBB domain [Roseomonas alkaliterrae]|uniref:Protein involved in polysaccharide export with SLBB domain n=1 Tax=Neoroseomonas alkaliterrae TaxID=1452450 RepID=A0A840Y5N5_9PROT|nr:polysaccharide biosynthesis/export family protein [Neoroseomonas alkaliterrae]MBB5689403.1 protein involved in polysaccharide export with SLBB domain [Neoroseomonas alkaliterrae]